MKAGVHTYNDMCNCLKLLLLVSVLLYRGKSHKLYYVKPTPNDFCIYHYCDTLPGYIEHSELFKNESGNITMTFLPGIHLVSKSLVITGLKGLFMNGNASHIQCTAQAYFKFK